MSLVAEQAGLWTCFRIQMRVIGALLLREMGTRFGRDNLGYLWLFAEPAMLGGAIGFVHYISDHGITGGLDPTIFWITGYTLFYLFRGIVNRAPVVIAGNQSLLYHRRVTLLDIIIARNLLEVAAVGVVMAVFLAGFVTIAGFWPVHFEYVLFSLFLMGLLSHGICLLIAVGSVYTELFERITHLFTYLSIPIVGAFFMVFWLPSRELQLAVLTIPTVHIFEMMRFGLYGTIVPTEFDVSYVLAWCALTNLIGMAGLRRARRFMVV